MTLVRKNRKKFFVTGPNAPKYKGFWSQLERNDWERDTYAVFDTFINKKHSYIDMGAWVGPTALYGCQLAKHCYAIEPDPIAFKGLQENFDLNPSLKDKITLINACISTTTGNINFGTQTEFGDSQSSILFANSNNFHIVKSFAFEDFIKQMNIDDCDFIKIDIEGGETIVLPSMSEYLQKYKPVIFVSLHPYWFLDKENDVKKVIDVLKTYKNLYRTDGQRITPDDLSKKMLSMGEENFSVVAADRWSYFNRLIYRLKNIIK